jgi:hypothetical protein
MSTSTPSPSSALEGATTSPPEGTWPASPGEFAAQWNAHTEAEREVWLARRIEAAERATRCFVLDHEHHIEHLTHLAQRLATIEAAVAYAEELYDEIGETDPEARVILLDELREILDGHA